MFKCLYMYYCSCNFFPQLNFKYKEAIFYFTRQKKKRFIIIVN